MVWCIAFLSNRAHSKTNLSSWESRPRITTYKTISTKRITLLTCSGRLKMRMMGSHHCLIGWGGQDLIIAFFPCIYFCQSSQVQMTYADINTRKLDYKGKTEKILQRSRDRQYFYELAIKLFGIVHERGLRLIMENPYSGLHYLLHQNFVIPPTMIDRNRWMRGDYFTKPTMYWFVNCEPTNGMTLQADKDHKAVWDMKQGTQAGICSEERSMISPDYARNFICDFLLGKAQENTQLSLFE